MATAVQPPWPHGPTAHDSLRQLGYDKALRECRHPTPGGSLPIIKMTDKRLEDSNAVDVANPCKDSCSGN
jgi:hypothetical protein